MWQRWQSAARLRTAPKNLTLGTPTADASQPVSEVPSKDDLTHPALRRAAAPTSANSRQREYNDVEGVL